MTNHVEALEGVEVVTELFRLFSQGRLEETFALMHPEVVMLEPGDPDVLPWAGEFRGHDGLRRFYAGLAEGLSHIEIESESLEVHALGDNQVLARGTETGTVAATGRSYTTGSAWIWTVEGGLIRGLRAYHDTAAMMDAFREGPAG